MSSEPQTEVVIGRDTRRGGTFVELHLVSGEERRLICEVFYSSGQETFIFPVTPEPVQVPASRVEELIRMARLLRESGAGWPSLP